MDENIQELINQPLLIIGLINYICDNFSEVYYECKKDIYEAANISCDGIPMDYNPISYYLYGHCYSFYNILYKIFKNDAIPYTREDHIITKIGNTFFDVSGIIPNEQVINDNYVEADLYDMEMFYLCCGKKDELEESIEKRMTELGLEYINNMNKTR